MRSPAQQLRRPRGESIELNVTLSNFAILMVIVIYVAFAPIGLDLLYNPLVAGEYPSPWPILYGLARYAACLAFAGAVLLTRGRGDYLKAVAPLAPFLLFCAISSTWSFDAKNTYKQLFYLVCLAVWIAAIVEWIGVPALLRVSAIINSVIVFASLFLAVFVPTIGLHHAGDLVEPGHAGNWRGMFIHKNILGEFSVTTLLLLMRDTRREPLFWKGFFWAARFTAFTCLIFAKSSSALVGLAAGAAAYGVLIYRPTSRPLFMAMIAVIAPILIFGFSITPATVATLLHRSPDFTGRTDIWAFGLSLIRQHLWLGHGYAASANYFDSLGTKMIFASATELHNGYLDLLFDGGVVGCALLSIGVLFILVRAYFATLVTEGAERQALIAYIAIIVSACAMASGESSPFRVVGDGVIGFWIALVALSRPSFGVSAQREDHRADRRASVRLPSLVPAGARIQIKARNARGAFLADPGP